MNIIVYSKSNCPNCVSAKALLDANGLDFTERSVDSPEWREVFTRQYPDIRQMPQIFYRGERLGGLEGLKKNMPQLLKSVANEVNRSV